MRQTTIKKEKAILKAFKKMLRSGMDLTTSFMYTEAGKPCYITGESAGHMIRKHYKGLITPEMKTYLSSLNGESHNEKVNMFASEFDMCVREARLFIRYIKRGKS